MKKRFKLWWIIPGLIFGLGLYSMIVRFIHGLGASTHLSDQFPWGLWVGFDVMCGVATAAGAFTLSAAVYVLHLDRYKALVRSAILTGFIGYLMVICGLMFDLGHPYRIWHPLIMWNPHSVMFEISWCVTLYTTVLTLEFGVFLSEGLHWDKLSRIAHSITVPLVITGVILSTLHQSSLGSLFLIVPYKLYPLWYTPWLPIFFFSSALALGCAMVIVESFASSKVFKKELELDILSDLGRVLVVTLGIYGIARFLDLADRGALHLVLRPGFERCMFLAEVLLAPIGPLVLLLMPRARKNRFGLFMGASMVAVGFVLNRFNVSMTGLVRASGTKYLPSWMEISVTFALVTLGLVLFGLAAKYLNIFPLAKPCLAVGQTCADQPSCCLPTLPRLVIVTVWVAALSLIFNGIRDFRNFQPQYPGPAVDETVKSIGTPPSDYPNIPQDFSFPQSAKSPGKVTFSHGSHLMVTEKCTDCHGRYFNIMPEHRFSAQNRRDMHKTESCGRCHDGKTAGNECSSCHK